MKQIREDYLAARKSYDTVTANLLSTLIGEVDTKTKSFVPARDITEAEVVAIIKKFIKNIDDTIPLVSDTTVLRQERSILDKYVPKQMTKEELHDIIVTLKLEGNNLGQVMKYLKDNHAGLYDGKLASQLTKEIL